MAMIVSPKIVAFLTSKVAFRITVILSVSFKALPISFSARLSRLTEFSMIITAPSTTRPKSTAPIDIRFPGIPLMFMRNMAKSIASGMVTAITRPARTFPRSKNSITITKNAPSKRLITTVLIVFFTIKDLS